MFLSYTKSFLFQKTIHNLNIENKNHILKIKECGFTNLIEWQKINGFVQKIYNIINKKDQKIENVNNNHISKEIKENIMRNDENKTTLESTTKVLLKYNI